MSDLLPGEKPTLKTIARISGLAVPTVSRALNDAPDIRDETKAEVRKIADRIGYVPNRAGVRLRTGRTNVISLVLRPEDEVMNNTGQLITSITQGLRGTPFHLNITPYFADDDPIRAVKYVVETRSADALILNQTEADDPRVEYLMARGFPFTTHGRTRWCENHSYYDYDNHAFGQFAVDHLAGRGRKHIALIAPPRSQLYSGHMIDGVTVACAHHGIRLTLLDRVNSDQSAEKSSEAITALLAQEPSVDAVICAAPVATVGVVMAVETSGRTMGQDIDVLGKESQRFLHMFRKGIIAVREDMTLAGAFLAKAALQAINDPDQPPMQHLQLPQASDLY